MVKCLTNPFRGQPPPLGSLITAAGQRLSAELDASLHAAGFSDLRAAHAAIFMAVDPEGTRLTELAHRAKMTKQAAGELVRHLVDRGYLTVAPEPTDRRAKKVQLTERGWLAIEAGQRVVDEFDRWLETSVGAAEVAALRDILTRIAATGPIDR